MCSSVATDYLALKGLEVDNVSRKETQGVEYLLNTECLKVLGFEKEEEKLTSKCDLHISYN